MLKMSYRTSFHQKNVVNYSLLVYGAILRIKWYYSTNIANMSEPINGENANYDDLDNISPELKQQDVQESENQGEAAPQDVQEGEQEQTSLPQEEKQNTEGVPETQETEGPGAESAPNMDDDSEGGSGAEHQESAEPYEDYDEDEIYGLNAHKVSDGEKRNVTQKKNIRKTKKADVPRKDESDFVPVQDSQENNDTYANEDPQTRRRRLLEEKMDQAIKSKTVRRRRTDEDDLERMQDDRIDALKDRMIRAANTDVERISQGQIATEKLKLLKDIVDVLSKADLAISILDNNLLEAVRLWLEPLPDASMPAYQIQKEMIHALTTLPIKTDHLVASGIGKVLVFYQRSKRVEPNLKKIVNRLIGDWTRPILNKSDSYKDRHIQFHEYNKSKFTNQLSSRRVKSKESKTLYEESAERRKRAAIPTARTTAYKIAPKVDPSLLRRHQMRSNMTNDERFKRLNQKLTLMNTKRNTKKSGPSIEGRNLTL